MRPFPLLLSFLLLLPSCTTSPPSPHSGNGLKLLQGEWVLQSIDGHELAAGSKRPTLTFEPRGSISAFGGVNRLTSTVDVDALDNNTLSFKPFASTLMAGPPDLMALEAQYLTDLSRANRYHFDGPNLILQDRHTELLRFLPQAAK